LGNAAFCLGAFVALQLQWLLLSVRLSVLLSVTSFVNLILYQFVAIHSPTFLHECTTWHKTLVPLSWVTRSMGKIVSYRYHGRLYYAVLVQRNEADFAAPGCWPALLVYAGLLALLMLHCALTVRLSSAARHEESTQRLVRRMLRTLRVFVWPPTAEAHKAYTARPPSSANETQLRPRAHPRFLDCLRWTLKANEDPATSRSRVHSDGSVPSNSQSTNDARGVETGEEERQECAICIEEYASGDRVVALPCGHLLHQACLVSWTKTKLEDTACPLCKATLVPEGSSENFFMRHNGRSHPRYLL